MDLRTVRYVLAVADAGSVVRAAEALHLTQPALSRQVRALESDLGTELFVRGEGPLRPSAAGRQLLPTLRDLVERADAADRAARAVARGRLVEVVIAATPTTITDIVAPFVATLGEHDPWPQVRATASEGVYRTLGRGTDLALGPHEPPDDCARTLVAELPVFAYVRADHPLAGRGSVPVSALAQATLLVQPSRFHARSRLNAAMGSARVRASELHEFDSAEVAMAMAAAGRGVAVVSDDPRFGLVQLRLTEPGGREGVDAPVAFSLFAAWEKRHHAASQLETLSARLADFCADRYGSAAAR